jgi:uncharacterized protein YbjT (DUF2867 family)
MITVMGATGNTGGKIAHTLLEAGHSVRALGRSEAKLAPLAGAGAETRVGDVADASFLADAFGGADAVYTLLPTDKHAADYRAAQDREGEAIAHAVRASGVRYVVALSALGGDIDDGTGVIVGLHAQEERLKQLDGANLLILRPVSFFENFLDQLDLARQHGIIADSVAPDVVVQFVASRDVADVAVRALAARDWRGVAVRELLGPRDFTMRELTRMLGTHLGNPDLAYVQQSETDMVRTLVDAGLSESFASRYVEMTRAFNERRIGSPVGRTPDNTTPTQFEDFAAAANLAAVAA